MQDSEQRLFERWCRRGDAQALGELFDATAPRLLKLAIHLAGDAAAAEDLLQQTFLAAIEQRTTIDSTRPPLPWLSGVLAHKAQQLRRAQTRVIDPERLHERLVADPAAPMEQCELAGALAEAIDKLDEPYRKVLLLRARHGMEIADIAHLLERDPGTVSVQLHRGVERLRRLLPASLTACLVAGALAPRGIAAVRTNVLAQAAAVSGLVKTTSIVGGLLVFKKLVAAVAFVLLAALLWTLRPREELDALVTPHEVVESSVAQESVETPAAVVGPSRVVDEPAIATLDLQSGKVVDAETGAPIAGADIALFTGREADAFELQRDSPEFYTTKGDGRLMVRTRADWPLLVGADDFGFLGKRALTALDLPREGQAPSARTTSDAQGGFRASPDRSTGLVEVAREGYATRWRPFTEGKLPERIALWREKEVRGRVVDVRGAALEEPVELVLTAAAEPSAETIARHGGLSENPIVFADGDSEGLACQRITTSGEGRFQSLVGASTVMIEVLTPGWTVQWLALHPVDGSEIVLTLVRVPLLHFFDGETGAPIERVRVLARGADNAFAVWSGEVAAPNGLGSLPQLSGPWGRRGFLFTAWAPGFEPGSGRIDSPPSEWLIEVPMRSGAPAAIEGLVTRGGSPSETAVIHLGTHDSVQWAPGAPDWKVIDIASAEQGGFRFEVPAGTYVLGIRDGDIHHHRVVRAPTTTPLRIDLDALAAATIEVIDQSRAPRPNHVVALQDADGRTNRQYTDAQGRTEFTALPAGAYKLVTPHVSSRSTFSADVVQEIELEAGANRLFQIETISNEGPRHARVVAKDTSDYTGWRARYSWYEWNPLAADGTIPMDLTTDAFELYVEAPDGREWMLSIPKQAPDGYVITLDPGEARIRGRLLDAQGDPLQGVKVIAFAQGVASKERISSCCTSGMDGRFEIAGLSPRAHSLSFERGQEFEGWYFHPGESPSLDPQWIDVRLAKPPQSVSIGGTVKDSPGAPRPEISVSVDASMSQPAGVLKFMRQFTTSDGAGKFQFRVPSPTTIKLVAYTRTGGYKVLAEREVEAGDSAELTVDLTLNGP